MVVAWAPLSQLLHPATDAPTHWMNAWVDLTHSTQSFRVLIYGRSALTFCSSCTCGVTPGLSLPPAAPNQPEQQCAAILCCYSAWKPPWTSARCVLDSYSKQPASRCQQHWSMSFTTGQTSGHAGFSCTAAQISAVASQLVAEIYTPSILPSSSDIAVSPCRLPGNATYGLLLKLLLSPTRRIP